MVNRNIEEKIPSISQVNAYYIIVNKQLFFAV